MGKSLVIVESPAKARTINKYLGRDFVVKSSVGHIRDLPTSGSSRQAADPKARAAQAARTRKMSPEQKAAYRKNKSREQLIRRMGIDPDHDWAARYEILPGKEKVVAELQKLAVDADTIFLATDLDREGEAIAWHLRESIGGDSGKYRRVVFNEITQKAIRQAFSEPSELDMYRVNAQQARRFLDRLVGFMVSPLLWAKIARGLSAGRVQSVAVRMLVEREQAIRAFVPEEYWDIKATMKAAAGAALQLEVKKCRGQPFRPDNEADTLAAVAELQGAEYLLARREDKPTRSKPPAPLITSTLQQAASTRLGFSVKKTMMMAQRLYEAGHITYMRTDSTNLSQEAVDGCRAYIGEAFGARYLPDEPLVYQSKSGAQEAHEAIRPSSVQRTAASLSDMERDAQRLYDLIWRQFVACQMTDAEFTSTSLLVHAGDYELRTRGRIVRFDGFMKVLKSVGRSDEDRVLPDVQQGEKLTVEQLTPNQHFTKPLPRYTEAGLVKELEKLGIGRPSTYASIISTIQDRGYVRIEKRRFYAEKMGDIVTGRLLESFADLMDYRFTARLEVALDEVAEGQLDWKSLLDAFFCEFRQKLAEAEAEAEEGGMRANAPTPTELKCPDCQRPMMIRTASTGVFLGCSGYALPPKERCKKTVNLIPGDEAVDVEANDEAESLLLRSKRRCGLCNTAMDSYLIDENSKLHVCGNNPDCAGYEVEQGSFKIKGYDGPVIDCDKCGATMQLKTGRFGKYFGCTSETCKNTRKLLKSGEAAPPKMDPVPMPELPCAKVDDHYILRDGAAGMFLAASQYPRNRETRAPLLRELIPHQNEIDPKYSHLFKGPIADPDGNPSIVRYSRKTKEQYLTSEVNGKASKWRVHFREGRWQEEAPARRSSAG